MTFSMIAHPAVMASASFDFDVTMVIQFVIFALAIGILHTLLIKPYLAAREARTEGTSGSREDAEEMAQRAEQLLSQYEGQLTEARREAVRVREAGRAEGVARQEAMVAEVRAELSKKLEEERATLQQSVKQAQVELDARAEQMARLMVERVLPGAGA